MWQYPSDYVPNLDQEKIIETFRKHKLNISRMIGGSKSTYKHNNPYHEVYFNANVVTINYGKVWHGDLDVDVDKDKLINIAKEIGEPLFILYEMDARFDNENKSTEELVKKYQCTITPDGDVDSKNKESIMNSLPYKKIFINLTSEQTTKIVETFVDWQVQLHGLRVDDVKDQKRGDWFNDLTMTKKQQKEFNERAYNYLKEDYKLDEDQVEKLLGEFSFMYSLKVEN